MGQETLQFMPATQASQTVDLRILETTDLHVHLHPYDYYADQPNPDLGLSRLSELVDIARAEAANTLLFDNGDFLQGTPVGDFYAYDRGLRDGEAHPVIAAMNALRYDAITLGNHEFNYGLAFLEASIAGARFPVVSSNIARALAPARPRRDSTLVRPYSLIQRQVRDRAGQPHPLCVGVLGVAPPQIMTWERQQLAGRLQVRDMVEAVRAWLPQMREDGADLVVLLAHSGIGAPGHTEGMENAVIPLAQLDGVDVVLSGHAHQVFPSPRFAGLPAVDVAQGTVAGKPTVMSGFFGSHLGVVDLQIVREGGRWRLCDHRVANRALRDAAMTFPSRAPAGSGRLRSPAVRRIVGQAHDAVLASMREPIGATRDAIDSFFVYLGDSRATALVAQAQRDFVLPRLDAGLQDRFPVLSSVSPAKAGGLGGPRNYTDIAPGELTLRALADLYVYPNRVAALRLTGAQIAQWLERAASAYNRLVPGCADQPLMNPDHPGYNFEIVYGLDYAFDLSAPPVYAPDGSPTGTAGPGRVRDLHHGGTPVAPEDEFILCTNSFRAQGAGGFPGAGPEATVYENPAIIRDVLRGHVEGQGPLSVPARAPFRLQPLAGATALLDTAPEAHARLDAIARFAPEVLGADARGFLRLRLALG